MPAGGLRSSRACGASGMWPFPASSLGELFLEAAWPGAHTCPEDRLLGSVLTCPRRVLWLCWWPEPWGCTVFLGTFLGFSSVPSSSSGTPISFFLGDPRGSGHGSHQAPATSCGTPGERPPEAGPAPLPSLAVVPPLGLPWTLWPLPVRAPPTRCLPTPHTDCTHLSQTWSLSLTCSSCHPGQGDLRGRGRVPLPGGVGPPGPRAAGPLPTRDDGNLWQRGLRG